MTSTSAVRRIAAALLRAALKIAPPQAAEWGQAMLAELHHVESDWLALAWSLGSAGVLARHAVLSVLTPGSNQIAPSEGNFFAKEKSMRKSTAIAAAVCIAASLLFFAAPTFRAAFRVSLKQWDELQSYEILRRDSDRKMEALAGRARQADDAEGLAFAAIHEHDAARSAQFAEQAVQMDPRLTWIYAPVAADHPTLPDIEDWARKLESYDPQNAIPRFIVVEKLDIDGDLSGKIRTAKDIETPDWQSAMAAAFASPKFDDYGERVSAVDRAVVQRYKLPAPDVAQEAQWSWFPSYTVMNVAQYSTALIASGDDLDAHHDAKGARTKYLAVAKFLPLMHLNANRRGFVARQLQTAYERLASLSQQQGNASEAQMYGQLATQVAQSQVLWRATLPQRLDGDPITRAKAMIVKLSGMLIPACAIALLASLAGAIIGARSFRWAEIRARRLSLGIAASSTAVLLAATSALYLVYRPYSHMLSAYLVTGDNANIGQFSDFLSRAETPLDVPTVRQNFPLHFWFVIVALCAVALSFAVVRFASQKGRALSA